MTNDQKNRTEDYWGKIAGENVGVDVIGGAVYGFCSELGVRRIADKMNSGRTEYSKNLESWFYCNE